MFESGDAFDVNYGIEAGEDALEGEMVVLLEVQPGNSTMYYSWSDTSTSFSNLVFRVAIVDPEFTGLFTNVSLVCWDFDNLLAKEMINFLLLIGI